MGLFSVSYQILNSQGLTKAQFTKQMNELMKKKGYVPAKEDEDGISFSFLFSSDRRWISFAAGEDLAAEVFGSGKEAEVLSRELNTYVIRTEIVDSDFTTLDLYDNNGEKKDTLILGDATGSYDCYLPVSDFSLWNNLLPDGATLDQMKEIQERHYTFAEDTVANFNHLIGIQYEYDQLDHCQADEGITVKYKAASARKPSFKRLFKEIYTSELSKDGFVLLKTKTLCVGKLVNDEILQVISYEHGYDGGVGTECTFHITAGIGTIYKGCYDLNDTELPLWMDWISNHYHYDNLKSYDVQTFERLSVGYSYYSCDEGNMKSEIRKSLQDVKHYLIPIFNKMKNLQDCIDCMDHCNNLPLFDLNLELSDNNPYDGIVNYVVFNKQSFQEFNKNKLERELLRIRQLSLDDQRTSLMIEKTKESYDSLINRFITTKNDHKKMKLISEELSRRKKSNLIIFSKLGLKTKDEHRGR